MRNKQTKLEQIGGLQVEKVEKNLDNITKMLRYRLTDTQLTQEAKNNIQNAIHQYEGAKNNANITEDLNI